MVHPARPNKNRSTSCSSNRQRSRKYRPMDRIHRRSHNKSNRTSNSSRNTCNNSFNKVHIRVPGPQAVINIIPITTSKQESIKARIRPRLSSRSSRGHKGPWIKRQHRWHQSPRRKRQARAGQTKRSAIWRKMHKLKSLKLRNRKYRFLPRSYWMNRSKSDRQHSLIPVLRTSKNLPAIRKMGEFRVKF